MINTITFEHGVINVLVFKRQLHAVIHLKPTLALPDKTQIAVVDQNLHIRQAELRTHSQLFHQKLKVIIAGQTHHSSCWVCGHHTQCGRDSPAQWASLAAIDPLARTKHFQELCACDLTESDRADVDGIARKGLVHLLIHPQRLDGGLREMGLAVHVCFSLKTTACPIIKAFQRCGRLALARHLDQQLKRRFRIANDAQVWIEHASYLRRLDIDVDELAPLAIHLRTACVAICPAVADADHKVRGQHGGIAIAMAGLQAHHARHERVVVRDGAPTHQSWNHWHARQFSKLHQQVTCIRIDDAAACNDEWLVGLHQHI